MPGSRLVGARPLEAPDLPEDAPRVGVLALQGDVLEHVRMLGEVGARASRVRTLADLEAVDALVIPGGESTTIGKLLTRFELMQPVRDRIAAGMPVLGTCAGLILLSDRLDQDRPQPLIGGLDVTTRRNAFGNQLDSFEADLVVDGIADEATGGPMHAVFIRAPWIAEVGDDVEVLCEVDGHPVVVRQGPLIGAAFHPELTDDTRLHAAFVGTCASKA